MNKDLENREDLHQLMSSFYDKATKDDVIGDKFDHLDMQEHIPKIVEFWSSIIFYDGNYKGNPFDKHLPLKLEPKDFERWIELFEETTQDLFEGERTVEILARANSIAKIFQHKIESLKIL